MNRREFFARFLGGAVGAAVAHTLDLDKLLWVPGQRTIFLPHSFELDSLVVREGLRILENNLSVIGLFNREYDHRFDAVGHTVSVRLPQRWKARA